MYSVVKEQVKRLPFHHQELTPSLIAQKASFWTPKIAAFPKKFQKNF